MKIEKLIIHNIASIADATIDFEAFPLIDSNVFLISGDTGSGKSTILDCICIALYGTTPRYSSCRMKGRQKDIDNNEIAINEPRQLLRRNSGEGRVELFFTGNDDVRYTALWGVKRARNKPTGRLQNKERVLIARDDKKVIATKDQDIRNYIDRAVGLDFDQFCRTCILAQGEFDRFLNSSDDEKAAILEKILGNTVYSRIGKRLFDVTAEKRAAYEQLKAETAGFDIPDDEVIKDLEDAIAESAATTGELSRQIKCVETIISWIETMNKLVSEERQHTESVAVSRKVLESQEFSNDEKFVSDYYKAERLRSLSNSLTDARRSLTEYQNIKTKLRKDYCSCIGYTKYLRSELQTVENEEKTDFDAERLTESYGALSQRLLTLIPTLEVPGIVADVDVCQSEREYLSTLDSIEQQLSALKCDERFAETTRCIGVINNFQLSRQALSKAEKKRAEDKKIIDEKRQSAEESYKELLDITKEKACADEALKTAKERYEEHRHTLDDWAKDIRRRLKIGDSCPVCGHILEEALPSEEQFAAILKPYENDLEAARKEAEKMTEKYHSIAARNKTESDLLVRLQKQFDRDISVSEAAKSVTDLLDKHQDILSENLELNVLDKMLNELNIRQKTIKKEMKSVTDVREIVSEARCNFSIREKRHDKRLKYRQSLSESLSGVTASVNSIIGTMPEWKYDADSETAKTKKVPDHTHLLTEVVATASMIKSLEETIDESAKNIAGVRGQHPEWDDGYVDRLVTTAPAKVDSLKKRIVEVHNNATRCEQNLENVRKRISEHSEIKPEIAEGPTLESYREKRAELLKSLDDTNRNHGAMLERRKRIESDINKLGEIRRRMNKAGEEFDRWNSLCSEMGSADGKLFRRIALSYVLENLVAGANGYMRHLFPRYTLSVQPGTYIINVTDRYMDSVNRAVSGISGGETFVVSLALALALADIGGAVTVNILFIDEGFGTLSGEPLSNAVETLRQLSSKAGRRVGIISHIEELRDRIPVQIRVKASPGKSESIIAVHPSESE